MRAALILLVTLASDGEATQALRERDAEIRAALPPGRQPLTDPERTRIESIVARIVDARAILEAALGSRWATLAPADQKRIARAFERRFRVSGGVRIEDMREARIDYLPEAAKGDLVVVPTRVTLRNESSDVRYVLRRTKDGWRIMDIVVDEVSVVENYGASFARIIGREGIDGLVRRLERTSDTRGGRGPTGT
jgi:phospholipid transport system substrate-binding protein